MNEEKRNRLLAAVTVNAILLLVILAAVVIYQLVEISFLAGRRNDLQDQIEEYILKTENAEESLDYYKSQEFLIDKAYEYGFMFNNN